MFKSEQKKKDIKHGFLRDFKIGFFFGNHWYLYRIHCFGWWMDGLFYIPALEIFQKKFLTCFFLCDSHCSWASLPWLAINCLTTKVIHHNSIQIMNIICSVEISYFIFSASSSARCIFLSFNLSLQQKSPLRNNTYITSRFWRTLY